MNAKDTLNTELILKELGMPMSTLITLLLKQIHLIKSIPFDMTILHQKATPLTENPLKNYLLVLTI